MLIVDGDPDIVASVEQILEIAGDQVASARNGAEALERRQLDVIILDLIMPVGLTYAVPAFSGFAM